MIENRSGSSSGSHSKIFAGVRFVLFGFDSVSEAQYRSELVGRGGTDVGRYDASCTHVIVCDRVYDDPVCVAAREDGKVLVTALWIEDSVIYETLADSRRVLYRPPRDMNGILGCKKLCICLTGYQRQEREDIMKMVSLMGARFTKPLVANEVTHLICYKFEGEKYDLARKFKIKLTSHRWLEDCLKAWEILPIDDYTKCGWEIETMEAEARDSEEETEITAMDLQGLSSAGGASSSRGDLPVPVYSHVRSPNMGTSSIQKKVSTLQAEMPTSADSHLSSPLKASIEEKSSAATSSRTPANLLVNNNLSTPCKDNSFQRVLDGHILNSTMEFNRRDAGSTAQNNDASLIEDAVGKGKLLNPSSTKVDTIESKLSSDISKAKIRSSRSGGGERYGTLSCLQKTSDKVIPEEQHNPSCSPTKGNSEKKSTLGEARIKYEQSPTPSSILPKKRKLTVSRFGSKSPQSEGQDSRKSPSRGISTNMGEWDQLEPASAISANCGVSVTGEGAALSDCKANQDTGPSKSKSLSYKKRSLKRRQPASSTKNSLTEGSPSVANKTDLLQNAQSRQALADSTVNCEVPDLENAQAVTSLEDKMLRDWSVEHGPRKAVDVDGSLVSPTTMPESLVSRSGGKASPEEKTPETNVGCPSEPELVSTPDKDGDVAMTDAPGVTGHDTDKLQKNRLDKGVAFPNSKDSGTRKLSSTDSTETCRENAKTALGVRTKKVVCRRTSSSIPMPTTKNTNVEKIATAEKSVNPEKAPPGKVKAGIKKKKEAVVEVTTNDVDLEDKAITESSTKKVVSRRTLSNIPMPTTENTNEEKFDTAEKSVNPEKAPLKPRNVEKVKSGIKKKKEAVVEVTTYDVDMKDKAIAESRTTKVVSRGTSSGIPMSTTQNTNEGIIDTAEKGANPEKVPLKPRNDKLKTGIKKKKGVVVEVTTYDVDMKDVANAESTAKMISEALMDPEKENKPKENGSLTFDVNSHPNSKISSKDSKKSRQGIKAVGSNSSKAVRTSGCARDAGPEPVWFILSGHRLQRKEFRTMIKWLNGRCCRDSHNWSYQATHFIVPDPVRRTEKFFAAAAAGRWILKTDYLTASSEAGKFLDEEPFEWHRKGLTEDGAINLESPRKWRLLREKTGHGAFHGMRIFIYGECIAPSLDTLKRVVKAGDGTILATSPPYARFLSSGVDYVVVSPSMPRVDSWIQEFLLHEIPCVVADYLVEYVCKAGYPLERHVLYNTHKWAEKSFANLSNRSKEVVVAVDAVDPLDESGDDVSCSVCGAADREDVMLICGDEGGSVGCGVGTHIDCCDPPLDAVPAGDWFCPDCSRMRKTPRKSSYSKSSIKCK